MTPRPPLHHRIDGPAEAPLLVLGPSLGTRTAVWEPHATALAGHYRVLRYDLPGHGGPPGHPCGGPAPGTPGPGRTTVEDLASSVLDLVDHHGRDRFHYAGISLGGAIGAQLAVRHPERVASLTLVCSSAHFGAPGPWYERAALVRRAGTGALLTAMPGRWFADPATAETPVGKELLRDLATTDPAGYAACCDALARYDLRGELARIGAPTLVLGGVHDLATPLDHARELAEGIPGATLKTVATGHLAVEEPDAVGAALTAHLGAAGRGL
ncbi:alpha/beta fold hydrolase [Streptomyces sp. NPDC044780]|uniref:alpha/beta fold hydrolase n=1 Tax=unclassified Streptomyces TaxID=2593676 RepID=UPI0033E6F077